MAGRLYRDQCGMNIRELCQDIYTFAKHYSNMYFARSTDSVLKSLYEDMKAIRMEVAYCLGDFPSEAPSGFCIDALTAPPMPL